MTCPPVCVGVLDDEPQLRTALTRLLKSHGMRVVSFERGEDLLATVSEPHELDCLLLDLHMPGLTGFDVLAGLDAASSDLPVVVLTGHDEAGNKARVFALHAKAYLLKPLDEGALIAAIFQAIEAAPTTRHRSHST